MIKSLSDARLTDALPRIVSGQDWVIALSEAYAIQHRKTLEFADASQIYTSLDTVSETILDALAVNWKIDWYDTGFSVDQKRRIVKACFETRRVMGTARAVKLQADAIYPGTKVIEWFNNNAEPGTFDLDLFMLPKAAEIDKFFNAIDYTKNVRSHLRKMRVFLRGPIEGPDLLDGRPEPGTYDVDIFYFLTYYGDYHEQEFFHQKRITFLSKMDFWSIRTFDGSWLFDGTYMMNAGRRYWMNLAFRTKIATIAEKEYVNCQQIVFESSIVESEEYRRRIRYHHTVFFWAPFYFDGRWVFNGDRYFCGRIIRKGRAYLRLKTKAKEPEERFENWKVTKHTKDYWFFDGSVNFDGSRHFDSIYREEET